MKSALRPWTVEVKIFEGPPTVGRFMGSVNYLISMDQTPHRKTGVKNTGGNGHCICMYIYIYTYMYLCSNPCVMTCLWCWLTSFTLLFVTLKNESLKKKKILEDLDVHLWFEDVFLCLSKCSYASTLWTVVCYLTQTLQAGKVSFISPFKKQNIE